MLAKMPLSLLLAVLLCVSCGVNLKGAVAPRPIPPLVQAIHNSNADDGEEHEEDSYEEAAEFFRLRQAHGHAGRQGPGAGRSPEMI